MLADIELTCKQKVVFGNLKNGNAALKSIPSEINIDDVQKLMDGTTEAKAYQDLVDRATNIGDIQAISVIKMEPF
ncbi:hypothetical protein GUJ93_ZPchr0002g23276 [Zizania palustris]|uniref:Uncharacterized protein n=1 Tax=Zizania palustris TaxID=103762 RepID=A0A8J5SGX9_ZIZPA|nr:hypothetical protein GUJ93_ZPchr0002g23276 [Zizania palustris]